MKSIELFEPDSVQVCSKCYRARTHSTGECTKCGSTMFSPPSLNKSVEHLKNSGRIGNHYTILRQISEGAFAKVYLVQEDHEEKPMVLKCPRAKFSSDDRWSKLFVNEAELWISLGMSSNIVTAHDVLVIGGLPHLLIEYVDGNSLGDNLTSNRMNLRELVRTAMDIANGLSFAWRFHQITHGDLHPENILIAKDGTVKITDFGLAYSYLHLYDIAGSHMQGCGIPKPLLHTDLRNPCFLSPEQLRNWFLVDTRSDVYAFGVLLYFMATGQFPFNAIDLNDFEAIRKWHLFGSVSYPDSLSKDLPSELAQLIVRCLNKNPEARYQDFESVWEELKKCSDKYDFTSKYHKYKDDVRLPIDDSITILGGILTPRLEQEGMALQQIGRHHEALEKFNQSLKLKPKEFSTWWNKGNSHFALGEIEQALHSFMEASQIQPDNSDVVLRIGRCQQKLGNFEEAMKCLDSFIRYAPTEHEELCYAYFRRGQIHTLYERYEQANNDYLLSLHICGIDDRIEPDFAITDISGFRNMLDLFKKTLNESDVLAWFLYNRGVSSFMNYLDRHIQAEPGSACFLRWKGTVYSLMSEDEKALQYLRRAHYMDPTDANITFELAELLTELKQLDEADRLISDILRQDSSNSSAWILKAQLLAGKGDNKTALSILEKMVVERPDDARILNNLGSLLIKMNIDLERAAELLAEAADLDPKSNTAVHNLIILYKRKKNYDLVLELCDFLLDRDPLDVEALLDKAIIYGMRGDIRKAEQYAAEARQLDPENEDIAEVMDSLSKFAKKLRNGTR